MSDHIRVTMTCDPDHMMLAVRAVEWLVSQPIEQKDAIITYGSDKIIALYVTRTRAGNISVQQERAVGDVPK